MKKQFYLLAAFLFYISSQAQLLPTGTSTTDNKFRSGGLAIGYTILPTFGSNKFMINGDQFVNGKINLGNTANNNDAVFNWGIKSDKPFMIANDIYPLMEIRTTNNSSNFAFAQFAIASGDGYFSNISKAGDVVLRGHTYKSFIISSSAGGSLKFTTKAVHPSGVDELRMIIDSQGNIGIGTETPDAKLAVNGVIHTKEVKVDLVGWPDYVFHENYTLPTLEEVEKHIIDNGHLINVPSAQEVESNGLKLGEMNKVLLEKIEELTLYILQMNKEIEKLKQQLNSK